MDTSSLPDDESARKQRELREQFPLGLAPYTRGNLGRFGFWGGIVGAGIGGAINLRRANQPEAIPRLLLLTLVILLIDWIVTIGIIDWIGLSLTNPGQATIGAVLLIVSALVGVVYARWISTRQNTFLVRWFELSGKPSWRDQGGCLAAIGWVIVAGIIGAFISNAVYTPLTPVELQIIHPPQRYTAEGVSVTTLAGWAAVPSDLLGVNCATGGATCLALVAERWTGSTAILLTISASNPAVLANGVALQLLKQNPLLPAQEVETFAPDFLSGRSAAAFSTDVGDRRFVYTAIADGDHVISVSLTCVNGLQPQCETLRDQFISTLEFSSEPEP